MLVLVLVRGHGSLRDCDVAESGDGKSSTLKRRLHTVLCKTHIAHVVISNGRWLSIIFIYAATRSGHLDLGLGAGKLGVEDTGCACLVTSGGPDPLAVIMAYLLTVSVT